MKKGIIWCNLGTPKTPNISDVRTFLREFLSDPDVITLPRALWYPVLFGLILPFRSPRCARTYRSIWTEQGSPLKVISERQHEKLQYYFSKQKENPVHSVLAMRYGQPSISEALKKMKAESVERLLVFPLYPQYARASTGSVFTAIRKGLKTLNWQPEIKHVENYYQHPAYINALTQSIKTAWQNKKPSEYVLFSFHGLPKKSPDASAYEKQCRTTAQGVAQQLELPKENWQVVFQSRVGHGTWLQPYLDETLMQLPKKGHTMVDVVCPGFAADCLETLEEIAIRGQETFLNAGGERLTLIPALNDSPAHIQALSQIAEEYL